MKKIDRNGPIIFSDSEEEMESRPTTRRDMTIEEYKYELEVAQYYSTMLTEYHRFSSANNKDRSNCNKSGAKQISSRAVQTDPELSSIPPSWLKSVQALSYQLHAGLGNLINSMYHQSNVWKYLKHGNGFWQSTMLPHVRIPAPRDFKGVKHYGSEDMRQSLHKLLELARKLDNVVPELHDIYRIERMASMEGKCEFATDDSKSCVSDLQRVKESIYAEEGVATSSKGAYCSKVLEAMDPLEGLKNRLNPCSAGLKSLGLISQETEVNGEKTAFCKNSAGICDKHDSSKENKTGHLQIKIGNLAESRTSKPDIRPNFGKQVQLASQNIATRPQTMNRKTQTKIYSKVSSKTDLNRNGSVAGGSASSSAEFLAAGGKRKIPADVLADCSNRHLRAENNAGNAISIKDIKKKLNLIEEGRSENRPPNFIRRNILALKAPVIQRGPRRLQANHAVSKFSKRK